MADINWADFKPAPDQAVPKLVAAITHVESGGNPDAVSSQGATGSMQITPVTFQQYALPGQDDYGNDKHRSAAAVRKIVDDYVHFGGDLGKTAAAYIGGRGAVRPDGTIRDDVADANGTTPAAYAQAVVGRIQAAPKVDWSQFKPVPSAGAGRGAVNPPAVDPNAPAPAAPAGSTYQPPELPYDPESSGPADLAQALQQQPDAGGGRGFVNPPGAAPAPGIGDQLESVAQSFGRGYGRAGAQTAMVPSLLVSATGVAWDALHSAVSGKTETGAQDWMFRNLVDPRQQAVDWYAVPDDQKQGFMDKVADSLGTMAQDLPMMIASGGAKQRAELAQQFPTMARHLENVFSAGYDAMRPIMVKAGTEKAQQVLQAGGTPAQAMNSATVAALWTGLTGGQPMSAEGKLLQRLATGIPVGMAQEEAGRVVQNAADPDQMQRPFDPAEMVAGGVTNAIAAGVLPHAGQEPLHRADLGYEAGTTPTAKSPIASAVEGMGATHDPIADVMNAPTVEAAVAAAERVATSGSVADEIRAIRPNQPVELNEGGADERQPADLPPSVAGADGAGRPDADAGVGPGAGADAVPGTAVEPGGEAGEAEAGAVPVGDAGRAEAVGLDDPIGNVRPGLERAEPAAPEGNPFRLFLMRQGVASHLAADFTPGVKERLAMGRTFRRNGMELDDLATRAWEQGFLKSPDDINGLYDLITRSVGGERIGPLYGPDGEAEMRARIQRQQAMHEDAARALDLTPEELSQTDYPHADPDVQARVHLIIAKAEAAGVDPQSVLERAAMMSENGTDHDYLQAAHSALDAALAAEGSAGARDRSAGAGQAGAEAEAASQGVGSGPAFRRPGEQAAPEGVSEFRRNPTEPTAADTGATGAPLAAPYTERERVGLQKDVNELNRRLDPGMPPAMVYHGVPTADMLVGRQIARLFGVKVIFTEPHPDFHGVAQRGIAFVSPQVSHSAIAIIGHETLHAFRQQHPEEAEALKEQIRAYLRQERVEENLDKVGGSRFRAEEEVFADLHGSMWLDPKFWAEMRRNDPNTFRRIAYAFMQAVSYATKNLGRFRAEHFVTDVDTVRSILAREMALAAKEEGVTEHEPVAQPDATPAFARHEDAGPERAPEAWQVASAPALATALRRWGSGKADETQLAAAVRAELDARRARREAATDADRVRGADWVQERLLRARRTGELTGAQADLALWMLNQAPHLATDLGISVRQGDLGTPNGIYNMAERVVTIFANKANDETAAHEILHHTERMLPADVQDAIRGEWLRQLERAVTQAKARLDQATGEPAKDAPAGWGAIEGDKPFDPTIPARQKQLLDMMLLAARRGDADITGAIWSGQGTGGVDLKSVLPYELSQPSEFWAVNGARLMHERAQVQGDWVGRAKLWLRGLMERAKSVLGLPSDAPVLRGLQAVLDGRGEFQSRRMLSAQGATFSQVDSQGRFSRKGTTAATAGMPTTAPSSHWERAKSIVSDLIDEGLSRSGIYRLTAPMSEGSVRARAVAQTFANQERLARQEWMRISDLLQKRFTPDERRQMWEAADEENTLRQQGQATAGRGLDRLTPEQRDVVEQLHTYGEELLRRAKNAGMFEGEGLPYWTPRMMVMIDGNGEYVKPTEPGKKQTSEGQGRNVVTSSPNLKQRKYVTAAETEAAMKAKGGELVRDIMTMPLAMQRLERAIAGRELINQIKDLGKATGTPTVSTGRPDHEGWFTLDHNAFTTFQPRFVKDEATGKMRPLTDENGDMVFDRVPLYMSKEFEGPVKAILSNTDGPLYRAFMLLKSKSMSAIMFSPLIHNLVILGRAFGYDPTIAGTLGLYYKGFSLRHEYSVLGGMLKGHDDHALMRTAIEGGMVPMGGNRQGMMDVTDVARGFGKEGGWLDPQESWIAHGAGAITKAAFGKAAGAKVKNFIDKAGDIWHGTLLWDRVADLQMGIFAHAYERLQEKGFAPGVAKVMAAHWANRYAGAIARENMSEYARKAANVLLFSRSFNMGNLGTVKDLAYGMPSGLRAKIEAEYGRAAASKAFTEARRKAWSGFVADAAMSLIALSLAQSVVDRFKKDKSWDEIFGGYTQRAQRMWENIKAHPASPTAYSPWQLSPTHDNEPGKENRVDMGEIPDQGGRHEYMRLPTGKVVEDLFGWTTHFPTTFEAKTSPLAKAVWTALTNDKGFGVPVYDPNGSVSQGALDVAKHLAQAQTPWDTIVTAWDKLHGKASAIENDKLVGNVTGFSFSQGHPQGPEAGVAQEVEDRVKAQKMLAMEEVKRLLRYDDEDAARQKLEDLNLSPREVTQIIKRIEAPKDGMTRGQQKRFNQHSNEDDQQRMDRVTK